jgi:hypothetical protein
VEHSYQSIQGDLKVSVQLMITIQNYLAQSDCLVTDCQGQGDTRLTLTPSVITNSNYVIMVSDETASNTVKLYTQRIEHKKPRNIFVVFVL